MMRFLGLTLSPSKGWLLGLILMVAIAFSGCSIFLGSKTASVSQVVVSVLSDPATFNAVLSQESPNIFGLTAEGLLRENPLTGKTEPALAESWEISEDKLSITLTLRDNLKWSDGHPLTVDDVIFSYQDLYLNEKIQSNARDSLRVGKSKKLPTVTKLDQKRVKFTVVEPFAPFLGGLGLPLMPAHLLRDTVFKTDAEGKAIFLSTWGVDTPPNKIIVNGPYQLKSYATNERLIFEANPYYWRKDEDGKQLPHIKQVVWNIVESTDTSILQFRSGSLDSIGVSPEYFSLLKKEEDRGNFTIYNGGPAYGTNFISFNLNKGLRAGKPLVDPVKSRWFNNVKFRQAIAYGIDRQRAINNIFRGLGEAQYSPISVQSPFYYKELQGYEYNPEKAKNMLLEAGFKYNEEKQLLDDRGHRVRFSLITNAGNKVREAMGTQIQQDLGKLGIQVDYTPIAFNVLVSRLTDSLDWECFLLGLTGGNEPNDGANVWFPDGNLHMFNQKPQAGRDAIEGWEVSDWEQRIADLYIEGAKELDPEKRKVIYDQTQKLTEEYLPFIYLVNNLALSAVRDRFEKITYSALGGAFWNLEELKLSAE